MIDCNPVGKVRKNLMVCVVINADRYISNILTLA